MAVMFYCCRFLPCLQTGASYIWSYWPTHTPSICGLVWMRGADSWEVVTQQEEGHWYQGQLFCILLQALTLNGPALKHRLLPATMKRHHYRFIKASQKENIVLSNKSMYIITMHFLYKAVCIWGRKKACVLLLSLTFVWQCPRTIFNYPTDRQTDRSSPCVIYLIVNSNIWSNQWHWTNAQAAKQTVRMDT